TVLTGAGQGPAVRAEGHGQADGDRGSRRQALASPDPHGYAIRECGGGMSQGRRTHACPAQGESVRPTTPRPPVSGPGSLRGRTEPERGIEMPDYTFHGLANWEKALRKNTWYMKSRLERQRLDTIRSKLKRIDDELETQIKVLVKTAQDKRA